MGISAVAMIPVAATVYGEAADQNYDTKVHIASTILNRLESGKKEFGADTGSITAVLEKGYNSAKNKSKKFSEAMSQKFTDPASEKSYKETLAIVSGILKGTIKRKEGQFILTEQDIKDVKKYKLMDMTKLEEVPMEGKKGAFKFYKYKK